ncbi:hypothetical protein LEP1GSC034_3871 [Leptospira interrogans str. 2003000735]|uniref:Uncharacterized protein n=2 Tax=Leptospira interrogans TaxID=173 RepID=A0A829D986_LEPIR|nr:hypothetical protein [Leptospira interrogans]EMY05369.1 hypothetical protein LEP1GSC029_3405 [Leptospira interrogans str. 2002000626]EMY24153.1 hypothetical protein LEP1GSC115_2910 [Leptospira interrogans serovar Australis str. 200703203]EKN89035.1 hypothetical protein LEP1GSC027_4220 [Leptospira interrogans str. 2002000624]EKQ36294.1 hypothetical protein LEP1GSC025_0747 [Leptospira interrogans str. 2002000621]EKQ47591.1 hypothetical protein LEP1GSC026_4655 [Leptospira interrogans str. 2002
MSEFEIIELILLYTFIGTLLSWVIIGLVAFIIWFFVFKILNDDTPKFQDVDRKYFGGYQPNHGRAEDRNPPKEKAGGGGI